MSSVFLIDPQASYVWNGELRQCVVTAKGSIAAVPWYNSYYVRIFGSREAACCVVWSYPTFLFLDALAATAKHLVCCCFICVSLCLFLATGHERGDDSLRASPAPRPPRAVHVAVRAGGPCGDQRALPIPQRWRTVRLFITAYMMAFSDDLMC